MNDDFIDRAPFIKRLGKINESIPFFGRHHHYLSYGDDIPINLSWLFMFYNNTIISM